MSVRSPVVLPRREHRHWPRITRAASISRSGTVVGASRCTAPDGRMPAPPYRSMTRHWAATSSPACPGGEPLPEVEASALHEGLPVEQDAAAHPGDAVQPPVAGWDGEVRGGVGQVRGVVQRPAREALGVRADPLRQHLVPGPQREPGAFVGPAVAEIGQPLDRGPDESAAGRPQRPDHAVQRAGLEPDVVVEEEDEGRTRQSQEVVPVLGQSPAGQVPFEPDRPPLGLEDPHHRPDRGLDPGRGLAVRLVAHDHAEGHALLRGEARECHGEFRRAPEGGDQDVDGGLVRRRVRCPLARPARRHGASSLSGADRILRTTAAVERSGT
ncbi:hypothetical protein QFZ50_001815 [Arthrobacter agilis]|nr:hypothetical protein [Arthrobacter agilis]